MYEIDTYLYVLKVWGIFLAVAGTPIYLVVRHLERTAGPIEREHFWNRIG